MNKKEKQIILNSFNWIKIKKFFEPDLKNPNVNWKDTYKGLLKHHKEETSFLIEKVRELVRNQDKNFKQVIKEFHIGFLVGHLFSLVIWSILQNITNNAVIVFPWYYISVAISYIGLWVQLLVVYLTQYKK